MANRTASSIDLLRVVYSMTRALLVARARARRALRRTSTMAAQELRTPTERNRVAGQVGRPIDLLQGPGVGRQRTDLVLLDESDLDHLAYHYGVNPVRALVKN